ncbi:MAG: VOC family protein [Kiritimatiellae bacterium]|nr:VOC family protein [Kiritimatiellia bacterium]
MLMPKYLELTVTDMAAAKAFYTQAFGIEFTDYGPEYAGAAAGGMEIAIALGKEAKPPMLGFRTDDIATAREVISGAGGEILSETYEFPGGGRFHFRDPAGNEALYYQYDE